MHDIKIIGWRQERESEQLSYTDVQLGRLDVGKLSIQRIAEWIKENKAKVDALQPHEFINIPGETHNWIRIEYNGKEIEVEISNESTTKIMEALGPLLKE